jgi:hypothetical protein
MSILQNFTSILLTMPILQKPYVYNAPCLSPFCKNLCQCFLGWAHCGKAYVHELWLCRPFCKTLCWRSSTEFILQKLMLKKFFKWAHFAKTYVEEVLQLSPFCRNLCWRSSSAEPILQKLMLKKFFNWAHFAKNLCWSSSTESIFANAYVDFCCCCCCCCEAAKSINYMVQSYCTWIVAEFCTKQ